MQRLSRQVLHLPGRIGRTLWNFVYRRLRLEEDSTDEAARKVVFTLISCVTTLAGFLWGTIYLLLDLPHAVWSPWSYCVVLALTLAFALATGRYRVLRTVQLVLIFLLPFGLHWSLGGFTNSGAVFLWAFLAPLGASIFVGRRSAALWFGLFVAAVLGSAFADSWLLEQHGELPRPVEIGFFLMNIGAVSATVFGVVIYFVTKIGTANRENERLLLNVLPKDIVPRIQRGEGVIADRFENITVLFADIVGFTELSRVASVQKVVELVNSVFSRFDRLAARHGVEKIKTIGDAYMAVSGVPHFVEDHADRALALGRDMHRAVKRISVRYAGGRTEPITVRVGIATGIAMAGVVRSLKYHYDVWGQAVNEASRIEAQAAPGSVLLSEASVRRLTRRWDFSRSITCNLKGIGERRLYVYDAS